MRKKDGSSKVTELVMMAMIMCLIMTATMFIKIPIPFTQGYVHLGDAMIFLGVLILGKKKGAFAAGAGSAFGDIIGGFAFWAPWTLAIKFVMAWILGEFIEHMEKRGPAILSHGIIGIGILGMTTAGVEMTVGYYVAESLMYGNWVMPAAGILWNIGQFAVGMVISCILAASLYKTPVKKYFAYK